MALVQKLGPNAINKIGEFVNQQSATGAAQPPQ
jgi:hypothetical protein